MHTISTNVPSQMIAVISQCEVAVDKLQVVKQMNEQEAKNYAKLHQGERMTISSLTIYYPIKHNIYNLYDVSIVLYQTCCSPVKVFNSFNSPIS